MNAPRATIEPVTDIDAPQDVTRLRDLSPQQWKSGIAAWLGWMFDGLDMHLYVLVAGPFVAELLGVGSAKNPEVGYYSSWIQAAFLFGWALGGGFFGMIADRMGRSRALVLTILTYALFTGLSFFAQAWWHLLVFRFLAALGIGGEWAVGASLLSETWPRRWRPWMAAVLQTGVNLGVIMASLANFLLASFPYRTVFLVGVLPALLVLWIRRSVPEPEEWQDAQQLTGEARPSFADLFRGSVRRTTILALAVCGLSLSGHWAFLFWYLQHLRNLPSVSGWTDAEVGQLVSKMVWLVMVSSIVGNFFAAWLGAAAEISSRDSAPLPGLLRINVGHVRGAARLRRVVVGAGRDRPLPGSLCTLHDVFAATISDAVAHDRRGILLQLRPHRRRYRHGVLRPVFERR